jgi:hypothetical protein
MLADNDLMRVQSVTSGVSRPVTLRVHGTGTEDSFEKNLLNVARQIAGVSSYLVRLEETDQPVLPEKPSITLSSEGSGNIHYLAAPEGPELNPFLDALAWLGHGQALPESLHLRSVEGMTSPAELLVLIGPACPYCPNLVRKVLAMAVRQPLIRVTIVDVVHFEDLVLRYKAESTPTLIVNDALTFVGDVAEETIAGHLIGRDETSSLTHVLETMIRAGRAEDAAALVCGKREPHALLPLYLSRDFPLRVGALVAMEKALDRDPQILDPIVEDLIEVLSHDETALRGDTAALLGKIGDRRAVPALRGLADDHDPDVREAAEEALELLGHSSLSQGENQ